MNRYIFRNAFLSGAIALLLLAATGCCERKKEGVMGPEETVEAFCRAVAGGEFEKAARLCDTTAMKGYIQDYAQALDMLARKDSAAVSIAAGSLAEASFEIEDTARDGDRRIVTFTIDAGNGMNKKKTAAVRKEEGEWKVEKITDSL